MKVSVVTVSLNQAKFLERAIRSVIGQDYHDIEYIVVDPGSTDGSRGIVERHRERIAKVVVAVRLDRESGLLIGIPLRVVSLGTIALAPHGGGGRGGSGDLRTADTHR